MKNILIGGSIEILRLKPWMLRENIRYSSERQNANIFVIKGFPGLWGHNDFLKYFKKNKLDGCIVDFGFQIQNSDIYVEKLHKILKNKKNITIIGISSGGLIALKYAIKYGWDDIEKIITISTPFGGSKYAKYVSFLPHANECRINNNLFKKLNKLKFPKNKLVCITAKRDDFIDNNKSFLKNSTHIITNTNNHTETQLVKNLKPVLDKYL